MSVNGTYASLGARYVPGELRRQASGETCGIVDTVEKVKVQHGLSWAGVKWKRGELRSVMVLLLFLFG